MLPGIESSPGGQGAKWSPLTWPHRRSREPQGPCRDRERRASGSRCLRVGKRVPSHTSPHSSASKRMGGTGPAVPWVAPLRTPALAKNGWDDWAPNPPVGALLLRRQKGSRTPPSLSLSCPGNSEPAQGSRPLHAMLAAFPCRVSSVPAPPLPCRHRIRQLPATPESRRQQRRPGAAGHRVWPLVPAPPEAGAYRERARRRRNWADFDRQGSRLGGRRKGAGRRHPPPYVEGGERGPAASRRAPQ